MATPGEKRAESCDGSASSGTKIDANKKTLGNIFKSHQTRCFPKFNTGLSARASRHSYLSEHLVSMRTAIRRGEQHAHRDVWHDRLVSATKPELKSVHPVLMARDVRTSINFYGKLGFDLLFQDHGIEPKYAGVVRQGVQLHLQWADAYQWSTGVDRPVYRFLVSDVDGLYAEFRTSGTIHQFNEGASRWSLPAETPWGTYEFHLSDPGQNGLQFYQMR